MSAIRDAMSHAVLGWVKPELDETLRLARMEVESFVDEPTDTTRMDFCAGYLHQVQGTLRMVELYAPAMVAEELELLARALQEGTLFEGRTSDRDEACGTLMATNCAAKGSTATARTAVPARVRVSAR